jgi:hypothetical protein
VRSKRIAAQIINHLSQSAQSSKQIVLAMFRRRTLIYVRSKRIAAQIINHLSQSAQSSKQIVVAMFSLSRFCRFSALLCFIGVYLICSLWAVTNLSNVSCQRSDLMSLPDGTSALSPQPVHSQQNKIPATGDLKQKYGFTAAICVCIKDAEAYFEEWVDFHLAMEFSNIYIYDDSPTFELKNWYRNSRNHPIYSRVEITHYNRTLDEDEDGDDDGDTIQSFVYRDCVDRFGLAGPKHDYFAFIDVDEFLVLKTEKYSGILGVLQDYLVPYGGALTVNWMLVGSANKAVYSPLPVTKRFQYRDNKTTSVIKSIAKASDYVTHRNPHSVAVRYSGDNEHNIHTTAYPGALHEEATGPTGASDGARPSDILLLYHYRYTSMKEYIFKRCVRGDVDRGDIWCSKDRKGIRNDKGPDHIQSFPGSVYDDTAWQFLKARVPKYQMYDEFEDFH